jgi:hypothetical protein
MRAECGYERDNDQNFANPDKHEDKLMKIFAKSTLTNPYQRSRRQQIEERNNFGVGQMNAAAGSGPANAGLVGRAVNINVTRMRIHIATAIEARLQSIEPQDACGDLGIGKFRLRCMSDNFARFENRPRPLPCPNFFRDAMQSQGSLIRTFDLTDAET